MSIFTNQKLQISIFTLLFFPFILQAQMVTVQNEAQITLSSEATLTLSGHMMCEGEIANEGNLIVSGDYINEGVYASEKGYITLDGKKLQSFNNNSYPVYGLVIDGKGEKLVNGKVEVTGEIYLRSGVVTPFENSQVLVKNGAEVRGGYADSYVNGTMFHEGVGYKFFPIGTNGHYLPLELLSVNGESPVVGYTAIEPNPGGIIGYGLKDISKQRVWKQDVLSGKFESSQVSLAIYEETDFTETDVLVVAQSRDLGSAFGTLGQSSLTGDIFSGIIISEDKLTDKYVCIGISDIAKKGLLYVPNALSPLSSNPEEQVVKVYGRDLSSENFEFRIFNRWGNVIYETRSFDQATTKGWDGKMENGTEVQSGVYNYTLTGEYQDGKKFEKVGSISLIK